MPGEVRPVSAHDLMGRALSWLGGRRGSVVVSAVLVSAALCLLGAGWWASGPLLIAAGVLGGFGGALLIYLDRAEDAQEWRRLDERDGLRS